MMTKMFVRTVGAALTLGFCTPTFAGGGAPHGGAVFHPPMAMHGGGQGWGHGGGRAWSHGGGQAWGGHGGGSFNGGVRMQAGGWGYRGHGTSFYGHTDTSLRNGYSRRFAGAGFGEQGREGLRYSEGHGHVNTGFRYGYGHAGTGFREARAGFRYGARDYPGYRYGYGGGYGGANYGTDYGSYGSDAGQYSVPSNGIYVLGSQARGDEGSTETGYGGGAAPQGYAEPPLNAVGYGGGPHIIVVHGDEGRSATCTCRSDAPVVYRYGVGSYY